MPVDLSGTAEAAELLGLSRSGIERLVLDDPTFPRPTAVLSAGRLWNTTELLAWAKDHPRRQLRRPRHPADLGLSLSRILMAAYRAARRVGDTVVSLEDLWLALGDHDIPGPAEQILEGLGVQISEVERHLREQAEATPNAARPSGERLPRDDGLRATPLLQVTVERANYYVAELRDDTLDSRHLLLALLDEWQHDRASLVLHSLGLDPAELRARAINWTQGA